MSARRGSASLAVAIAACVVAALALLVAFFSWQRIRELRRGQQAILGGSTADVVDFAVSLQGRIDDLHRAVDEVASASHGSTAGSTARSRTCRSSATTPTRTRAGSSPRRSRSSTPRGPGTVVTAIQGRDYARVYVKELERGKASLALSPEEAEAVERAMAR